MAGENYSSNPGLTGGIGLENSTTATVRQDFNPSSSTSMALGDTGNSDLNFDRINAFTGVVENLITGTQRGLQDINREGNRFINDITGETNRRRARDEAQRQIDEAHAAQQQEILNEQKKKQQLDVQASRAAGLASNAGVPNFYGSGGLGANPLLNPTRDFLGL